MSKGIKAIISFMATTASIVAIVALYRYNYELSFNKKRNQITQQLSKSFRDGSAWPEFIVNNEKKYRIEYSFSEKLTDYIERRLKRYRSDYSTVIVIDNATSEILAAVGHERKSGKMSRSLPFSTSHPSASLFKIVTSAALLENGGLDLTDEFSYRGKGSTLYRYQLRDKKTRWTRHQTLAKAFAISNNVIFGKAAQRFIEPEDLVSMANRFGFNGTIMKDINLSKSSLFNVKSEYELAELATGFNRKTMISPVHGALLASIVANNGIMKQPRLIRGVVDVKSGDDYWRPRAAMAKTVVSGGVSEKLKLMMQLAINGGTARGSFRRMDRRLKKLIVVGGKTGSITGGLPFGKHDWFTAYAIPKDSANGKGISICVLNINKEKWRVRSAYLAKEVVEYFYNKVRPIHAINKRIVQR